MADATIEVAEAEAEATTRSQMEKHQGFVDWYNANYTKDMNDLGPAEVIAEFARLRNTYRKSDDYLGTFGPEARAAAREQKDAERERMRAEKEAARAQARAAKEAAKAEADAAKEAAGETTEGEIKPARKRTARKAKSTPIEVDSTEDSTEVSDDEAFE
jgi:hypothetical protein